MKLTDKIHILRIDVVVKACYTSGQDDFPASCKRAVETLGLPSVIVNPIVDRAFRSHLNF